MGAKPISTMFLASFSSIKWTRSARIFFVCVDDIKTKVGRPSDLHSIADWLRVRFQRHLSILVRMKAGCLG